MPTVRLDAVDAIELAEVLQFINDWFTSDRDGLNASLQRFINYPDPTAYDLDQLRHDLDRFAFLLGGNDGEPLFGHSPQG